MKNHLRNIDYPLLGTILFLCAFGLLMVYSASYPLGMLRYGDDKFFFSQQLISFGIGLLLLFTAIIFPYRKIGKLSPLLVLVSLLLLVLVLMPGIGVERNYSQRWLQLGPLMFQPSEAVKLAIVVYFAQVYASKQHRLHNFKTEVLPPLIILGLVFVLILIQPDLGTATSLALACGCILLCSNVRLKHLLGLGIVGLTGVIYLAVSESYRLKRILSFRDPFEDALGDGYQLVNSYYAIASGGITGNGLGNSFQKFGYLPEAHTDFIMAVILEELGTLGFFVVVLSYLFIMYRGVRISIKGKDPFLKLLAVGLTFMIMIQAIFNLGAITGLLPITGITLPFISYGGSSLILLMAAAGILVNLSGVVKTSAREQEASVS